MKFENVRKNRRDGRRITKVDPKKLSLPPYGLIILYFYQTGKGPPKIETPPGRKEDYDASGVHEPTLVKIPKRRWGEIDGETVYLGGKRLNKDADIHDEAYLEWLEATILGYGYGAEGELDRKLIKPEKALDILEPKDVPICHLPNTGEEGTKIHSCYLARLEKIKAEQAERKREKARNRLFLLTLPGDPLYLEGLGGDSGEIPGSEN